MRKIKQCKVDDNSDVNRETMKDEKVSLLKRPRYCLHCQDDDDRVHEMMTHFKLFMTRLKAFIAKTTKAFAAQ